MFITESKSKYSKNDEPPIAEITPKLPEDTVKNNVAAEVIVGDWIKPLKAKISDVQKTVGVELIKYEVEENRSSLIKCKDSTLDTKEKVSPHIPTRYLQGVVTQLYFLLRKFVPLTIVPFGNGCLKILETSTKNWLKPF